MRRMSITRVKTSRVHSRNPPTVRPMGTMPSRGRIAHQQAWAATPKTDLAAQAAPGSRPAARSLAPLPTSEKKTNR